jgi:hypothetical protein
MSQSNPAKEGYEIPKQAVPISCRALKARLKKANAPGVDVCIRQVWERHSYCSAPRLPSHLRPFKVPELGDAVVARHTPDAPHYFFQPEEPSIAFRFHGYHENFPSSRCTFALHGNLLYVTLDAAFQENSITCFQLELREVTVTYAPLSFNLRTDAPVPRT